jgi:hypothetical protein
MPGFISILSKKLNDLLSIFGSANGFIPADDILNLLLICSIRIFSATGLLQKFA